MPKPTFEESLPIIDREISKRKSKWTLTAISWMDFSDISQILRIHIYKKWHQYDSEQELAPWINTIISNQIKNLLRNNYGNYSRPCLRCSCAEGIDLCSLFGKQSEACPLLSRWIKTKKTAYDVKLPLPLENHSQEVFNQTSDNINIEKTAENVHIYMAKILKPIELRVYKYLYIDHKSEEEVAELMGYASNEKNRPKGYKTISNIKKSIMVKVKKCLYGDKIDIVK
jgi:DNA-directed RNA polymerase specialized sigma24 family protein